MKVSDFMADQLNIIRDEIIEKLPNRFDSHEFIRYFSKRFEIEYVELLCKYKTEPFKNVHGQIGKFLSKNQECLKIKSIGKMMSKNIIGDVNSNEKWEKT